jgi:hypothetical protein
MLCIESSTLLIALVGAASVASASEVTIFARSAAGDWTPLARNDATRVNLPAASAYRIEVTPRPGEAGDRPWDELVLQFDDDEGVLGLMRIGRDAAAVLTIATRSKPAIMTLRQELTNNRLGMNRDGTIDGDDLVMMLSQIEECHQVVLPYSEVDPWIGLPCDCRYLDLDFSGVVDAGDIVSFLNDFAH